MSECVVRMEMPESCEKCPACDYEEGNCLLADDRNTLPHNGKRRSWCPIICQLPEGHGRLIDADEIMQAIDEDIELDSRGLDDMYITGRVRERLRMDRGHKKVFKEYMRKRPTIVPADTAERSEA